METLPWKYVHNIPTTHCTLRRESDVIVTKIYCFSCINEQLKCAEIVLWVDSKFLYSLEHHSLWGTKIYMVSSVNEYL